MSEAEHETILANAEACNVSVPELLRQLGQGFTPKSTLDAQHIRALSKVNGDLGRLGGLLKLWLTDKEGFGKSLDVPETLDEVKALQALLAEKVRQL